MRPLLVAAAATAVVCLAACTESSPSAAPSTPSTSATSTSTSIAAASSKTAPSSTSSTPRPTHTSTPVTTTTTPRSGPVVVLNPGHDGGNSSHVAEINRQVPAGFGEYKECDTTGTTTNAGYPEHAYTWDVVKRVASILQQRGIRVVLTRYNDHGVGPCVDKRAEIGNHADVAAVVSIHGDGAPSSGHGFFVNTASRRPDGATAKVMRRNRVLAKRLRDGLNQHSGMTVSNYLGSNGIYATSKFAALNLATRPAAFLEIGNMRNSSDAALQSSASGRQHIADGVAAGILAYLGR